MLVGFLLVVVVAAVYWPVHSYPFVLLDDYGYVVDNTYVRKGLTYEGMVHAFTGITVGNWHPVTMLSHMLDCQLLPRRKGCGLAPRGQPRPARGQYGPALHRAAVDDGAQWRSALVAVLFGLHPLHVELVAWVSERKDVLGTLFFLLTLIAYHRYVGGRRSSAMRPCSCCWPWGRCPNRCW